MKTLKESCDSMLESVVSEHGTPLTGFCTMFRNRAGNCTENHDAEADLFCNLALLVQFGAIHETGVDLSKIPPVHRKLAPYAILFGLLREAHTDEYWAMHAD